MYFKSQNSAITTNEESIQERRKFFIKKKKIIEQRIETMTRYIGDILKQYNPTEIQEQLTKFNDLLNRNNSLLAKCTTCLDELNYQQNNNQHPCSEPNQTKPKM